MSEIYNQDYYQQYDVGVGKVDYQDSIYIKDFLRTVADKIVADLHPKTVLDAGCAMGHLVAALRDHGVEAYGIDISEYAISKVREDMKPYCVVGSLTEALPSSLPQSYDLIVSIEVLEHLYAEDGRAAIKNLCKLSDRVIFSSTPSDFEETTHVNVQQREYWARIFAEEGFLDDLNYRPTYLSEYAALFKREDNMLRQIEDYERNIRMTENQKKKDTENWSKAVEDKERHIQNQNAMLEETRQQQAAMQMQLETEREETREKRRELEEKLTRSSEIQNELQSDLADAEQKSKSWQREYAKLEHQVQRLTLQLEKEHSVAKAESSKANDRIICLQDELDKTNNKIAGVMQELEHYQTHYHAAIHQREELKAQVAQLQTMYNVISNAFFWKLTKPLRIVVDKIKWMLNKNRVSRLCCKGLRCWKENGFCYTCKKVADKLHHRKNYQALNNRVLFTAEELAQQRNHHFPQKIKFSIIVPLYNTPSNFLHEMIRSVLDQTYADWELCMADGSDSQHGEVERICRTYIRKDQRIKYKKLEKNLGISGNTNVCLEMATGDYIGLFDHDDLLHPAALYEVMRAICEQGADFIYTDENTFHNDPKDAFCPHFKPDYAPDTLRANNYICHFTVFQKSLLDKVGMFHTECDGSQDYDMVLRLTEEAKKIVHIPEILYYWRAHAGSVADDVGAKPYVIEAAHRALQDHLKRIGLEGEVLDTVVPSMYRMKFAINGTPLVSILIPNKDHCKDLKRCIDSIKERTTYPNWEIIIVENNSTESETFSYYKELQKDERIRVVYWKKQFNYSAINNFGAKYAKGTHFLLLNNDVEIISEDWIQEMLMYSQRSDVGAVGAKLYYPNNTIQHAGLGIGLLTLAGHLHRHFDRKHPGYMGRLVYAQNLSGVTAACMMVKASVYWELGGFDESFEVAFNDVDLCMRIRQAGYLIVWTPYAELYHYESKSRGAEDTPEKQKRFAGEVQRFQARWAKELEAGDPYYNPNLTLDREDFSIRE